MERKLSYRRREAFLAYIKKNFSPRIVYIEGETVDDGQEVDSAADSSVKGLTKQIISMVRELAGGGPPGGDTSSEFSHGPSQRASEVHTELRMELEEQEIMLRKTIKKLEMTAS